MTDDQAIRYFIAKLKAGEFVWNEERKEFQCELKVDVDQYVAAAYLTRTRLRDYAVCFGKYAMLLVLEGFKEEHVAETADGLRRSDPVKLSKA